MSGLLPASARDLFANALNLHSSLGEKTIPIRYNYILKLAFYRSETNERILGNETASRLALTFHDVHDTAHGALLDD